MSIDRSFESHSSSPEYASDPTGIAQTCEPTSADRSPGSVPSPFTSSQSLWCSTLTRNQLLLPESQPEPFPRTSDFQPRGYFLGPKAIYNTN